MSYRLNKPDEYADANDFSYKQWFQKVYFWIISREMTVTVTAAYVVKTTDFYIRVDCTAGAVTVTIPVALGCTGRQIFIKKIDSSGNAVTYSRTGTDTIEGSTTGSLAAQWNSIQLISNGNTGWEKM